jgi:hypothetical protein
VSAADAVDTRANGTSTPSPPANSSIVVLTMAAMEVTRATVLRERVLLVLDIRVLRLGRLERNPDAAYAASGHEFTARA